MNEQMDCSRTDHGDGWVTVAVRWESDADGQAAGYLDAGRVPHVLDRITTKPDPAAAPSANYDVELIDDEGVDLLNGVGANRSASAPEQRLLYNLSGSGHGLELRSRPGLRLFVTNAGSAKRGQVLLAGFDLPQDEG